jgi:hypothetical protein
MDRMRTLTAAATFLFCGALPPAVFPQNPAMPHDYPGVNVRIPGIFVTPVPNAPFSAKVDILSRQLMPDGSYDIKTATNHIARQSSGCIYNERRRLVSTALQGESPLLSALIYDPSTRLSISLDPFSRLARERVLRQPLVPPPNTPPPANSISSSKGILSGNSGSSSNINPSVKEEELGTQMLGTTTLRGIRKSRTIPADQSGAGKQIVIVDEYWYSPDLSLYLIIKHNDPRTGEQIVAVSGIDRHEPDPSLFAVPEKYKVVDETSPAE